MQLANRMKKVRDFTFYETDAKKKQWTRTGRFTSSQSWPQLAQDLLLSDLYPLFSFIRMHAYTHKNVSEP